MILVLDNEATMLDIENLRQRLIRMGLHPVNIDDDGRKALSITRGVDKHTKIDLFTLLPHVKEVIPIKSKFKLVGSDVRQNKTVIDINGVKIGQGHFVVSAGPCAIESREQIMAIAAKVSASGAKLLRGGAFKPRTSPYDFQGLGEDGLKYMREAGDKYDMLVVSEIMSEDDILLLEKYVDIMQVGSRNMQNFSLLKKLGQASKPVLLKRGLTATYNEFLSAAEYILSYGNPNVILCERGIRTFETYTRNTLDLTAVPVLKNLTHLPIIIDPSHGTGLRHLVAPMSLGALAVGADGIIVEAHTDPDNAASDAQQTLSTEAFEELMQSIKPIAKAMNLYLEAHDNELLPC